MVWLNMKRGNWTRRFPKSIPSLMSRKVRLSLCAHPYDSFACLIPYFANRYCVAVVTKLPVLPYYVAVGNGCDLAENGSII